MRSIAHISDPHFGTEDPPIAAALVGELNGSTAPLPSLVVLSGDLTQRARTDQFEAACRFLAELPGPYLVVPGNHDVPMFDPLERLLRPLARYRKYITDDLAPTYHDEELVVVGVDTAHGLTFKRGRITPAQTAAACAQLGTLRGHWKVLVAHHPFAVPTGVSKRDEVVGAEDALERLEGCGLDVILTGHLHRPFISSDTAGFRSDERTIILVHAGTCMSTRLRGDANGYNRLELDGEILTTVHRVWDGRRFADGASKVYRRCREPGDGRRFVRLR